MKLAYTSGEGDVEGFFRSLLIKKGWHQASLDDCNNQLFPQVLCIFNSETKKSISAYQKTRLSGLEGSGVVPDFCIILNAKPQFEGRNILSTGGRYIYFVFDESKPSGIRLLPLYINRDGVRQMIWRRVHHLILDNPTENTALFRNSGGISALYIQKPPK